MISVLKLDYAIGRLNKIKPVPSSEHEVFRIAIMPDSFPVRLLSASETKRAETFEEVEFVARFDRDKLVWHLD